MPGNAEPDRNAASSSRPDTVALNLGASSEFVSTDERLRDPELLFRFPRGALTFDIAIDESHRHILYLTDRRRDPQTFDLWRWSVGDDEPTRIMRDTPYTDAWVPRDRANGPG